MTGGNGASCGHIPGTTAPETLASQGRGDRAQAKRAVVPAWPRLLNIEQAAAYLNVSFWTLREFINDGSIRAVPMPRPNTLRMRERRALGDTVRRLLIDRADLDELVESWKRRA